MNILYLTFYFEPDLGAGSFRNTSLVKTLSKKLGNNDSIDVITTYPNRYSSYKKDVPPFEEKGNMRVYRINTPDHKNGFIDQINSFKTYFLRTKKIVRKNKYDLVFASSSRLFTAYLGYVLAHKINKPLYLDIRDIFADTIQDVLKNRMIKIGILPLIKLIERKTFNGATHINLISEGFFPYFYKFKCHSYSNFSNGIDDDFLDLSFSEHKHHDKIFSIVYAGNIGEGQGLEKIIPPAASLLGGDYKFIIIGDGGTREILQNKIMKENIKNIEIKAPVCREELKKIYNEAHFLFLHLNNYKAFEKVLPSKIFELAAYDKPIIAGVSGFSYEFIKKNISNVILFKPCDANELVDKLKNYSYKTEYRVAFVEKYKRETLNDHMAQSIINIKQ
jgi:hypothetical protein